MSLHLVELGTLLLAPHNGAGVVTICLELLRARRLTVSSTFEVRVDDPSFTFAGHGHRPFAKSINRVLGRELSGQVVAGNAEQISHGRFPIRRRLSKKHSLHR